MTKWAKKGTILTSLGRKAPTLNNQEKERDRRLRTRNGACRMNVLGAPEKNREIVIPKRWLGTHEENNSSTVQQCCTVLLQYQLARVTGKATTAFKP